MDNEPMYPMMNDNNYNNNYDFYPTNFCIDADDIPDIPEEAYIPNYQVAPQFCISADDIPTIPEKEFINPIHQYDINCWCINCGNIRNMNNFNDNIQIIDNGWKDKLNDTVIHYSPSNDMRNMVIEADIDVITKKKIEKKKRDKEISKNYIKRKNTELEVLKKEISELEKTKEDMKMEYDRKKIELISLECVYRQFGGGIGNNDNTSNPIERYVEDIRKIEEEANEKKRTDKDLIVLRQQLEDRSKKYEMAKNDHTNSKVSKKNMSTVYSQISRTLRLYTIARLRVAKHQLQIDIEMYKCQQKAWDTLQEKWSETITINHPILLLMNQIKRLSHTNLY